MAKDAVAQPRSLPAAPTSLQVDPGNVRSVDKPTGPTRQRSGEFAWSTVCRVAGGDGSSVATFGGEIAGNGDRNRVVSKELATKAHRRPPL